MDEKDKLARPHLGRFVETHKGSGMVAFINDKNDGSFVITVIDDDGKIFRVTGQEWNNFMAREEKLAEGR